MRPNLHIILLITLLSSCSNLSDSKTTNDLAQVGNQSSLEELNDWLNIYGINSQYFSNATKGELASAWSKEYKLEMWHDTLSNWLYSKDSTYILFTNFHPSEKYSYQNSEGSLTTDFFNAKTETAYRNLSFSENDSIKMIDIHWRNDSVIYFLTKETASNNYNLLEMTMLNDSATQFSK
jgi:hypothetical protein